MKVTCNRCGKVLTVPENLIGKQGKCPGCKNIIPTPRTANGFVNFCLICLTIVIVISIIFGIGKVFSQVFGDKIVTLENGSKVNISAIEKIISYDRAISPKLTEQIQTNEDMNRMAKKIAEYTQRAKAKQDFSSSPSDFNDAYLVHILAWDNMATIIAKHPRIQSDEEAFLEGFLRGLNGDITGGYFQKQEEWQNWMREVQYADDAIKNTWYSVERIAVKYGANIK